MTVEEWKQENPPIRRKPITNADRIRSMTDEELAKWICTEYRKAPWCKNYNEDDIASGKCRPTVCVACVVDWMREEVKE